MITDKNLARIAGLCYLIVIATGMFAEVFVRQVVRVSNNALETAQNIQENEMLFRWGITTDLINFIVGIPCVIIIYHLFKKKKEILMRIALFFVIIQTAIIAMNLINHISALVVLSNETYLNSFQFEQLATLSLLFLNIQSIGYGVGLVFFGFYCIVVGYVIYHTSLVPKFLGILYGIAGICYLINSFTMFFSKGFENPLFAYFAIPIFVGELSFASWLFIKGVQNQ